MTVTVVATPTAKTKRRDPLTTINMATSQAQARPASSANGKAGRKGTRSSARLSLNSQEKSEENSTGGKRKGSFDEDDDDFQFTRIKPKKSKPTVDPIPELSQPAPEKSAPKPSPKRGRPPKKRPAEKSETVAETNPTTDSRSKRSTRGAPKPSEPEREARPQLPPQSQTKPQLQPQTQPASDTRSTRNRDHAEPAPKEKEKDKEKKKRRGRPSKSNEPERPNGYVSPEPKTGTATIALPMADTPVIQRNKEMRGQTKAGKGSRRSSLGMRGRRASSLIDSGASNALPHKEVGTADFYKHIASDLPEPRRMRQLLTWCATRAMGDKPSGSGPEDASVHLAARVIQEEILKEFSVNSELSNWFSREDINPPSVVVKKPNPKNIQNTDKIKELEEQIQKLQKQKQSLNALLRSSPIPPIKQTNGQPEQPPSQDDSNKSAQSKQPQPDPIDLSLLDPSQLSLYALIDPNAAKRHPTALPEEAESSGTTTLPPITPSTISTRLSRITSGLAPTLDSFAAGVHDIELYRAMSDNVSSRILRICAERLDEREAKKSPKTLALVGEQGEQKDLSLRPRAHEDLGVILGALSRVERRG